MRPFDAFWCGVGMFGWVGGFGGLDSNFCSIGGVWGGFAVFIGLLRTTLVGMWWVFVGRVVRIGRIVLICGG